MSQRAVLDGASTLAVSSLVRTRRWALLHLRHGHVHDADPQVTAQFRRRTLDNGTFRSGGPAPESRAEDRSGVVEEREPADPDPVVTHYDNSTF